MAVRSQELKSTSHESTHKIALAPAWSYNALDSLRGQSTLWEAIGIFLSVIMLVIAGGLLFGGGYATIQGARIPLAFVLRWFHVPVVTTGFPSLAWWTIPAVTNVIQIFGRHLWGFRVLWWPSVIYDTTTSAVYLALGVMLTALSINPLLSFWVLIPVAAFVGSIVGFLLTVFAEKLFIGAIRIIYGVATGR